MRLAMPGHGGSRIRVRTRYVKYTAYHHGVVERRVGPLWLTVCNACGATANEALQDGIASLKLWETRTKKSVTYL